MRGKKRVRFKDTTRTKKGYGYIRKPQGVRKDNIRYMNIKYIKYKNSSRGVRHDGTLYIIEHPVVKKRGLQYSKPCLCGSLSHCRTRHTDCPLNPKYDDAII